MPQFGTFSVWTVTEDEINQNIREELVKIAKNIKHLL
jgi:hypothetical protein